MENVLIVAYSEKSFNISQEVNEELLKGKRVAVGINPLLRYKDGTDAIGCQIRVVYSVNDKVILEYAAVLTIIIESWSELLKHNPEKDAIINASKVAWEQTIGFVRGAICANATRTDKLVARLMLPAIDIEKFLGNVTVDKVA